MIGKVELGSRTGEVVDSSGIREWGPDQGIQRQAAPDILF